MTKSQIPKKSQISNPNKRHLQIVVFPTDFGWCALAASEQGLRRFVFGENSSRTVRSRLLSLERDSLRRRETLGNGHTEERKNRRKVLTQSKGPPPDSSLSDLFTQAFSWAKDFFEGRPDIQDFPLDLGGLTAFERQVLRATMHIPYGQTRTYSWLARKVRKPYAARAVGNALRKNPLPIFIPCHRVVRSDGSPGGYGGPRGAALKMRLQGKIPNAQIPKPNKLPNPKTQQTL